MARYERLSRGKRISDGKWVKGYFVKQYGSNEIYLPDGTDGECGFDRYQVSLETVGDYSEFTDRVGTQIFEGDIVKFISRGVKIGVVTYGVHLPPEQNKLKTHYQTLEYGFYIKWVVGDDLENTITSFATLADEVTVIGNVYDNPELLEVKEMKKVVLSVQLNANDDFEPGDCKSCPIVQKQYEELRYGEGAYKYSCPIGHTKITCPMEVK